MQVGFTDIHIEGDNKILIQAVQGHIQVSWEIQVLIQDIHTYSQLCNNVHMFNEVPHRDNLRILYEDNLGRILERRVT